MPLSSQNGIFGNLQAYKFHIRPTAQRLFGDFPKIKKTKHQQNIQHWLSNFGYDFYLSWLNLLPKQADSDDFTFVKST